MNTSPSCVEDLATAVVHGLSRCGATVVTAESCTGGEIASALSSVPGASTVLWGGYVVYTPQAKEFMLGVMPGDGGTVSEAITRRLADAALNKSGASVAVAVTCSAGPSAEAGSRVGESYVAVRSPKEERVQRMYLDGTRREIRDKLVCVALQMVVDLCGLTVP